MRALNNATVGEIVDIAVSCDGTWARRGFQSLYGIVYAIEVQTGKIVDFEIKGKCATNVVAKVTLM